MQTEHIRISAFRVGILLFAAISGIAVVSLTLQYLRLEGNYTIPYQVVRWFDFDKENNVPTWLSSVNLGICAVLLFVIAQAKRTRQEVYWRHFYGLAAVFLFLSLDEAASFHEAAQGPVERMLGITGNDFNWGWTLPAIIALGALGLVYLKFYIVQKPKYQVLFGLSALLYVGGAIGFELISWSYHPGTVGGDLRYVVLNLIEEVLEMSGVATFLISLLLYISDLQLSLCCTISSRRH